MTRTTNHAAERADRLEQIEYVLALFASLLALVMYVAFFLNAGALWRDEINSVNLASAPSLGAIFRLAEFDSFPLLWTLLLRVWIAIAGAGDTALRLAGVLGVVSVLAAVWIAARATGGAAPVVSLAIVAVHPEILRWCASVRAFGLGACLAVLVLVALIRAVESPTRARVLLAVAATVCSVQVLFQNAVFVAIAVAGAMLLALIRGEARRIWIPVAIGAAGALSLLPYLGVIERVGEWSPLLAEPSTIPSIIGKLVEVVGAASPISVAVWAILATAAVAGGARALLRRAVKPARELDRGRAIVFAALALFAPLVFALFLVRLGYRTQSWYYVGLLVFVAVCLDTALRASLRERVFRVATVALAGVALVAGAGQAWRALHEPQTIIDRVAARLSADAQPGDLVVVYPWFYALTLDRYYHGPAEVVTVPPLEDRTLHRYDLVKKRMLEEHAIAPVLDRMHAVLEAGGQVWLVGSFSSTPPGRGRPRLGTPPRAGTGWSVGPDMWLWSTETGDFIGTHATSGRLVYEPEEGVAPNERPTLAVVKGFRP